MKLFFGLISFIVGLYFFRNNIVFSIIITTIFVLFLVFRFRKSKKLLITLLGVMVIGIGLSNLKLTYNSNDNVYSGMVVEAKENYFIFQSHYEKYYVYEKENTREVGDFLVIKDEPSDLRIVTYESQFDFKSYLSSKGVHRELKSTSLEVKFQNPLRIKAFRNQFLNKFEDNAQILIDAFLFNNKDYSSELILKADQLNIIFLLSMGGIYLQLIMTGLEKLLSLKLSKKLSKLIPILAVIPYSVLSFPRIGVIRVLISKISNYTNTFFLKRKFTPLSIFSFSSIVLLIFDYHLAFNIGFLVGCSLSFATFIFSFCLNHLKKRNKRIITPILIYLFLLPISTFQSGEFHLFAFIFQTILIPFNFVFILGATLCLLMIPLYIPMNYYASFLSLMINAFTKADIKIPFGDFGIVFITIYYFLYFFIIYLYEAKRIKHIKIAVSFVIGMFLFSIIPIKNQFLDAVYFINVGQGDSILIENRNNVVMIDTGGNLNFDMAKETLIPFMNKRQINHIDALITTHDDYDHSGAKDSLMNNFKVKNYLSKHEDFPYKIGNIELNEINNYKSGDKNDESLVLEMNFMKRKWLFMGDASIESEKYLISQYENIECDILKVGHHGSNTSTCNEFLNKVKPKEAIISVSEKNIYHHPSSDVIERLEKHNVKIRRTDKEGTICYEQYFGFI